MKNERLSFSLQSTISSQGYNYVAESSPYKNLDVYKLKSFLHSRAQKMKSTCEPIRLGKYAFRN